MKILDEKTSRENQQWLDVYRMVMQKWNELAIKELDEDQNRVPTVDILEQLYYRAKWEKHVEVMMCTNSVLKRYESERGKIELVAWMFGETLGFDGSKIPMDIQRRLEWYKTRVATQFERSVKETFAAYGVGSPIEQLFVMEWHFQRVSERFGVTLRPQARVSTDAGQVNIDFVVNRANGLLPLAIELDGHEFHEKTKAQAAHDRKRERSIVRSGYLVVRFTGHEIFQDAAVCVKEVVDLITRRAPVTDTSPSVDNHLVS